MSTDDRSKNRDPITGAPGAHPVGTGLGAAAGGVATGAAIGTVAGPVGTAVGAAVGAVVGGLVGKNVAESIDLAAEDAYWRENFRNRDYAANRSYDDLGPAYAYGVGAFGEHRGQAFDDIDPVLSRNWAASRGTSSLSWDDARPAARDAWDRLFDRIEEAMPGDSDRDGR